MEAWEQTRKHSSAHSSWILCTFGKPAPCQWSNAHLLLFSGEEREALVLVLCCHWATNYLSNICCPSKLGQSYNRPEAVGSKDCLSSLLQQEQLCVQTEAPTPGFLLWISSGITLHHPPILQERGENSRPASTDSENRPPLFPLPLLSVAWGTWSTPPPPCNPKSFRTLPLLLSLLALLLLGGKTADHLMKILKTYTERTFQVSSSFVHIKSLKSRLTGSQI